MPKGSSASAAAFSVSVQSGVEMPKASLAPVLVPVLVVSVASAGTATVGSMDSTITLELTYVLVEMDGKSMIEIDKINPTYKVNGNDVLSKVKQLT